MNSVLSAIVLLVSFVCITGCTGTTHDGAGSPPNEPVVPVSTDVSGNNGEDSLSFGEEIVNFQNQTDNNPPISLKLGENTKITLKENPSTGYSWNVSVTDGLIIVNDTFTGPEKKQIVGAGGEHIWILKAVSLGKQAFTGVYRRSWEPPSDADTRYTQEYLVTK